MSYPKKHPALQQQSERDSKTQQRRDQMKTLLINKFRGKYNVTAENEKVDRVIKAEVEKFLDTEQMTETNLVKLDKKLSDALGLTTATHKKQVSSPNNIASPTYNNDWNQRES